MSCSTSASYPSSRQEVLHILLRAFQARVKRLAFEKISLAEELLLREEMAVFKAALRRWEATA